MIHHLKILPKYFEKVRSGEKPFEIRVFDRPYQTGDIAVFQEFDGENYTGREDSKVISCVFYDPEYVENRYCVLGLQRVRKIPDNIDLLLCNLIYSLTDRPYREIYEDWDMIGDVFEAIKDALGNNYAEGDIVTCKEGFRNGGQ